MNESKRTCIITGANSGIGKSAAFQIAGKGLRVILACRNIEQAEAVCTQIQSETGNAEVFARRVDLALVSDAKRFASDFTQEFGALNILINNAADFDLSRKRPLLTAEGNEVQFATNLLSPFMLIKELLPLMVQSGDGRIINIGTQGLIAYPNISFDFDNIYGQKSYSPAKAYYQTKLGLMMISLALRRRVADPSVSVYAVRVTNVKVDISRYPDISKLHKTMYQLKSRFSISPDDMAQVYTTLAIEQKRIGFYYDEKLREVRCNRNAYDEGAQERLWQICEQLSETRSVS